MEFEFCVVQIVPKPLNLLKGCVRLASLGRPRCETGFFSHWIPVTSNMQQMEIWLVALFYQGRNFMLSKYFCLAALWNWALIFRVSTVKFFKYDEYEEVQKQHVGVGLMHQGRRVINSKCPNHSVTINHGNGITTTFLDKIDSH